MPDISKCKNNFCPSRVNCYRFTSTPSEFQSYSSFKPDENEDKCSYFWKN